MRQCRPSCCCTDSTAAVHSRLHHNCVRVDYACTLPVVDGPRITDLTTYSNRLSPFLSCLNLHRCKHCLARCSMVHALQAVRLMHLACLLACLLEYHTSGIRRPAYCEWPAMHAVAPM